MNKVPFSEDELKIVGQYVAPTESWFAPPKIYNTPITAEQNLRAALKGEDNFLKLDYSNDKVCHLSDEGNAALLQALKDYVQEQYDLGLWTPAAPEGTESAPAEETDR